MESNITTLAALINGMIGTSLLMLPLQFLQAGLVNSIIITVITGIANYYSSKILYMHIHPKQQNYNVAINRHYKKKVFSYFDLFSTLADELLFYIFFNILTRQWQGVFYKYEFLNQWLPYIVCLTLFIWNIAFLKLKIQLNLMAFGIIGIFIYLCFILWVLITSPSISQSGRNFTFFTSDIAPLTGAIQVAISIQTIFIPILRNNADTASNNKLLFIGYVFGTLFYLFIGIVGGYGIVYRIPFFKGAASVTQYFVPNTIAPLIIQLIYFIHIYSIWPQWNQIQKNRFLNLLNIETNQVNSNTYRVINHLIALILYVLHVELNTLLSISGGILYFFLIYLIPPYIHLKCTYYHEKDNNQNEIVPYTTLNQQQEIGEHKQEIQFDEQCVKIQKSYIEYEILDKIFLGFLFIFGLFGLGLCLYEQVFKRLI